MTGESGLLQYGSEYSVIFITVPCPWLSLVLRATKLGFPLPCNSYNLPSYLSFQEKNSQDEAVFEKTETDS